MPPMNTTTRILPLGALAIFGLASCSLPPEQAWRQIRQDGLITYWMRDKANSPAVDTAPASAVAKTTPAADPAAATSPAPVLTSTAPSTPVPPPSQIPTSSLPVAQTVPGLDGYVRTPFTNPPRLVDVRGMAAGSKVVCPYTRRPFLVPQAAASTHQQVAATTPAPAPSPAPAPAPAPEQPKPQAPVVKQQLPQAPTKVAANNVTAPQPPPAPVQPAPQPQVKPNPQPQPQPQASTPPAPKPAAAAQQLPFGVPISGRPGFVNSPYAAKHQLVDVTGLPTGMEVKCPYTGKLFRVPPSASEAGAPPKN